jgi:hypothetical protein
MIPPGMLQGAPTPCTQQVIQPGMASGPPLTGMTEDQMLQMYNVPSPFTQPILMGPGPASSVVFHIPEQLDLPAESERISSPPFSQYRNVRIGTKESFRRR